MRFLIFLAVLLCSALPAAAMLDDSQQYTEAEKAGFAFHYLTETKPAFDDWLKNSSAFKSAARASEQVEMLRTGTLRLQHGFYSYRPDEDFIKAVMNVSVIRDPKAHRTNVPMTTENKTIEILINGGQGMVYFPFKVGSLWIAVLPSDIERHLLISYPHEEYLALLRKPGFGAPYNTPGKGILEVMLRPVSADMKAASTMDNETIWPMLAEIASLQLYSADHQHIVYSYNAPWFVSDERKQIMDLFGE